MPRNEFYFWTRWSQHAREKQWNKLVLFHGRAQQIKSSRPSSLSSVPPRASYHSVRAGYTLCLCVIPIDSASAQGRTCKPWTQPPQTGPENTEIPQAPVQVLSLVFVSFLPSVSLCLFIYHCAPLLQNNPWFSLFLFFYVHWPVFRSLPTAFVYQHHNVTQCVLMGLTLQTIQFTQGYRELHLQHLGNAVSLCGVLAESCSFLEIC